ncbi:MAG: hypothetical protein OEW75_06725 [Cyclobacteriaceae bacterium]|nr:hypothetical protein [Cyclobacteriaceae bacterium]
MGLTRFACRTGSDSKTRKNKKERLEKAENELERNNQTRSNADL